MPVWILIQEAPENGSNMDPDPQHWLKAFVFKGAGAGAVEKNTRFRSRSKMDRLRNTVILHKC